MKRKELPSIEYLNECFTYHSDGYLIWKKRPAYHFNRIQGRHDFEGLRAGAVDGNGRVVVALTHDGKSKKFYVHCIIWAMFNGYLSPDFDVDHEDGNTQNNQILNLRLATGNQNNWNAKTPKDNTSGVKGVYWNKRHEKWVAEFKMYNKRVNVGRFADLEQARIAIELKRAELQQEFANNGVHKHES